MPVQMLPIVRCDDARMRELSRMIAPPRKRKKPPAAPKVNAPREKEPRPKCTKCIRPVWCKGMCSKHYGRQWKAEKLAQRNTASLVVLKP